MSRFILFSFVFSIVSSFHGCDERPYAILFYKDAIMIDGADNESVWSKCEGYTTFLKPWEKIPAQRQDQGTVFKSFNNEEYLYFHFNVVDSLIICHEHKNNSTAVEYSDRVELFFAIDSTMSEYCGVEFDACGRKQQFYSKGYRTFEKGWEFPLLNEDDYAVELSPKGYQVEGRLSLQGLRQMGFIENNEIYLGVFKADRYSRKKRNMISWISWKNIDTPQPDFHRFQGFKKVEIEHP